MLNKTATVASRLRTAILLVFGTMLVPVLGVSCFEGNPADPGRSTTPTEDVKFSVPDKIDWPTTPYTPTFAKKDFNAISAQPWVEPVTDEQRDAVDVFPDRIEFPASMVEVADWEPGRVIVAAPGAAAGTGKNPLGFARRVAEVKVGGPKIVVMTTAVGLRDVITGDFAQTLDMKTATPVDMSKLDRNWAAQNLYHQVRRPPFVP
jgi:hypothetical protein